MVKRIEGLVIVQRKVVRTGQSGHLIDRINLQMAPIGDTRLGRLDQILRTIVMQADRVGTMREEIDDRYAMKSNVVTRHQWERLQPAVEGYCQFQGVAQLELTDGMVQARKIYKKKPFLEREVFL